MGMTVAGPVGDDWAQDDWVLGYDGDHKGYLLLMEGTDLDKDGQRAVSDSLTSNGSSIDGIDLAGVG